MMSTYIARFRQYMTSSIRDHDLAQARARWNKQAPNLRDQFAALARAQAAARGVRWASLEWGDQLSFARDRETGLLTAMVGFVIQFEAEDLLDDNENATIPRDATAIFHYQRAIWGTGGKTLFNMNPTLALARLSDQFEPVED